VLKCALHLKIAKHLLKTLFGEGGSRSFKVIDVDNLKSLSPVLVMISNMCVPICNGTRRAVRVKITFLERYLSLTP